MKKLMSKREVILGYDLSIIFFLIHIYLVITKDDSFKKIVHVRITE